MFFAAAVGSAVGISNVWKFTFVAGENGGGAFVLVYVAAVLLVALPALVAEFLVGRRGGASVVKSMDILRVRDGIASAWRWYGMMAAFGAFVALSFYAVVAGWTLDYFVGALFGGHDAVTVSGAADALNEMFANPGRMMASQATFLALTAGTVAFGVRRGLERVLGWLTPTLFILLLVLLAYAVLAGDMTAGMRFMFVPDFSKLDANVVLMAVGQAFFSLGIGLGVLFTIGAYMDRSASIVRAAIVVAAADVGVALLAGLAIFPIVFAYELSPAEGPGLIFATLPVAFGRMPGGSIVGPLFFLLMAVAALTSAITILETIVAAVEDVTNVARPKVVGIVAALLWLVGLATVFSFNVLAEFYPLSFIPAFANRNLFGVLDYVVSNFMMPAGGVLIACLAGWALREDSTREELGMSYGVAFTAWRMLVRFGVPIAIGWVFIANL